MIRSVWFPATCLAVAGSACLASAPALGAQPLVASQFPARVLAAQNRERAAVGVPSLVWDNALGTAAGAYAAQMAATGLFQHSDRRTRPGIAENIWFGSHGRYSVESMVAAWASEKRLFVPGIYPNISRTGNWQDVAHYTQMIWRTTQRVGCAVASTPRLDYLVCRYSPKGNIDGRRMP